MKKISALLVLTAIFTAPPVYAAPKKDHPLPPQAVEVAPGLYKLGQAYDAKSDSMVEGYAFVHKKNDAKSNTNAAKPSRNPLCYAVLASGAKWKNVEPWEVYSGAGLDGTFLLNRVTQDINTWETAAQNSNILGSGKIGTGVVTDPYTFDDVNQISFGDLDPNTIAVTVTWGTWSGPTNQRKIVAWDQVFNTDYLWSSSGEANKMDFANISTHELGHAMGLADIYDTGCSAVTMYGYGAPGETQKQTLETADITGINLLY
jgi:hypothetical protein